MSEVRLHPVLVAAAPHWHPEPASGRRAQQIRKRLTRLSRPHGTTLVRAADRGAAPGERGEDLVVEGLSGCAELGE